MPRAKAAAHQPSRSINYRGITQVGRCGVYLTTPPLERGYKVPVAVTGRLGSRAVWQFAYFNTR
eukprot:scaffold135859_cov63-Attheya_sp.AAC.1